MATTERDVHLASPTPLHALQFLKVANSFSLFGQVSLRIVPKDPVASSATSSTISTHSESPLTFHTTRLSYLHKLGTPSNFKVFRGFTVPKNDGDEAGELVAQVQYKSSDLLAIAGLEMLIQFPGGRTCRVTRHGLWREYIFNSDDPLALSSSDKKDDGDRVSNASNSPTLDPLSPTTTISEGPEPATPCSTSPAEESFPPGRRRSSVILRGTKSAVRLFRSQSHDPMVSTAIVHNGNLKFLDKEDSSRIIGLWENNTDTNNLGVLYLFGDESEWSQTGKSIEEMLCVVLAVVCYERVTAKGWQGGLGR